MERLPPNSDPHILGLEKKPPKTSVNNKFKNNKIDAEFSNFMVYQENKKSLKTMLTNAVSQLKPPMREAKEKVTEAKEKVESGAFRAKLALISQNPKALSEKAKYYEKKIEMINQMIKKGEIDEVKGGALRDKNIGKLADVENKRAQLNEPKGKGNSAVNELFKDSVKALKKFTS